MQFFDHFKLSCSYGSVLVKQGPRPLYLYPTPHVSGDPLACQAMELHKDRRSSNKDFQDDISGSIKQPLLAN